jgi:hypothetical protein
MCTELKEAGSKDVTFRLVMTIASLPEQLLNNEITIRYGVRVIDEDKYQPFHKPQPPSCRAQSPHCTLRQMLFQDPIELVEDLRPEHTGKRLTGEPVRPPHPLSVMS